MVQGAGGILVHHLKELMLHTDLKREDTIFYFTTCGWMMWNWLTSSLAWAPRWSCLTVPVLSRSGVLWKLAQDEKITLFGTSARYMAALEKEGVQPGKAYDLTPFKAVLSTGSPLSDRRLSIISTGRLKRICSCPPSPAGPTSSAVLPWAIL